MSDQLSVRPFVAADFSALTKLWHDTNRAAYPYIAVQQKHTLKEARAFFRSSVLATDRVWVATEGTTLVGLIAVNAPYITQLAVAVDRWRRGIGSALLSHVLTTTDGSLRLFTFQRNAAARQFYEEHGFRAIGFGVSPRRFVSAGREVCPAGRGAGLAHREVCPAGQGLGLAGQEVCPVLVAGVDGLSEGL